jgi:hypothetical protein
MAEIIPAENSQQGTAHQLVPSHLSPQIVEQLVSNQARDLELRAADLSLQQQKDANGFTYAMKALEAQAADRKDERVHKCRMKDRVLLFSLLIAVILCSLIGFCLSSGHEAIAVEIIKMVSYIGVGVFGGYGIGKRSSKSSSADDSNDSGS